MLNINKQTIIHIIVEITLLIGITIFFNKKHNKLEKKIEELFKKYETQEELIKKNDEYIKSLIYSIQQLNTQNQYYQQNEIKIPQQNEIKIPQKNEMKFAQKNEMKIPQTQNEIKNSQTQTQTNEMKIPQPQNEIKISKKQNEMEKPNFHIIIQKQNNKQNNKQMEIEEIDENLENLDNEIESELKELET